MWCQGEECMEVNLHSPQHFKAYKTLLLHRIRICLWGISVFYGWANRIFSLGDSTRIHVIPFSQWVSQSHALDTPHSAGPLWTSDQSDAETSTWQHRTITRDRHQCPERDLNPQSQQASGHKHTLRPRSHWERPNRIYLEELNNLLHMLYNIDAQAIGQ
jgi:hypothetical protein